MAKGSGFNNMEHGVNAIPTFLHNKYAFDDSIFTNSMIMVTSYKDLDRLFTQQARVGSMNYYNSQTWLCNI
jgi:hypothetical protein